MESKFRPDTILVCTGTQNPMFNTITGTKPDLSKNNFSKLFSNWDLKSSYFLKKKKLVSTGSFKETMSRDLRTLSFFHQIIPTRPLIHDLNIFEFLYEFA
jgi:hypothetical protein